VRLIRRSVATIYLLASRMLLWFLLVALLLKREKTFTGIVLTVHEIMTGKAS
jgi:hypothetical protein